MQQFKNVWSSCQLVIAGRLFTLQCDIDYGYKTSQMDSYRDRDYQMFTKQ